MPTGHVATGASPVQAKPKAGARSTSPARLLLCNNPPPVSPPGQRNRSPRRPALRAKPASGFSRPSPRPKQSIQCRPRTRQGRIPRPGTFQRTLTFTQLGILRKDDLFKVVFDPGPDKLKKRILGPAPSKRSTGVKPAQPRRHLTAKLNHSIGCPRQRQFSGRAYVGTGTLARPGRAKLGSLSCTSRNSRRHRRPTSSLRPPIPLRKRIRSRNPHLRRHHHTRHRRQILQRINLLPPSHSQHRPTHQK